MRFGKAFAFFTFFLLTLSVSTSFTESVEYGEQKEEGRQVFWLANNQVKCSVTFEQGKLVSDRLEALPEWSSKFGTQTLAVETDADFTLDVMWTGWRAPIKVNNAENPITLTKDHFRLVRHSFKEIPGEVQEMDLLFESVPSSLELRITYQLKAEAFYAKRKLAVRDPELRHHFLRWIWPRQGLILGKVSIVKAGGFGQPLALGKDGGGVFFGLEYPTSENSLRPVGIGKINIRCGQEKGERIAGSWVESEWVVEGLSPNAQVKLWFWKYLDRIRVAPLKPYLLYNSWYDVRAPEMVPSPAQVMNEENLLRIIATFQKELVEKRGIKLDAFVLDDGWDVYQSEWVLSKEQFPRGLTPVKQALEKMGTALGMWFSPIGGYSHRGWRVGWMHDHGYEVIRFQRQEDESGSIGGQLCLAGKNYYQLFKKRVMDFRQDGVGYYKWDGIQFSCSEPGHGHPVGIYSRRAIMESVIDLCGSVRTENPNLFLNITSGTWLSPWWVKYANMIWMQGHDYGYSDVPSLSQRDAAITYRDYVLFDDLRKNEFWFPMANLMTHGIIKGHLQKLGGEAESLDKFTDNALLYFARGVSMWELYISPDLLTAGEWKALAKSIHWARDRFDILRSTEMIGGDPGKRSAYGYVHFCGSRGIVAVRNPFIAPQTLKVVLSSSLGLDPNAASLVLERIYPTRWVASKLYAAEAEIVLPLQGYETAIYEIYPLEEASVPLLAGVTYEVIKQGDNEYAVRFYESGRITRLLNPDRVLALRYGGKKVEVQELSLPFRPLPEPVSHGSVRLSAEKGKAEVDIKFKLLEPVEEASLVVLLEPARKTEEKDEAEVKASLDGKEVQPRVEKQRGGWAWYLLDVRAGKHTSRIMITPAQGEKWTGKVSVWLDCLLKSEGKEISFDLAPNLSPQRPMPPQPWSSGEIRRKVKLGEVEIQ